MAAQMEEGPQLKELRAQITAGMDALDRDDVIELNDAELDAYLERLPTPATRSATKTSRTA
jgi:hypothetical protein